MVFSPQSRKTLSLATRITGDFGASIALPAVVLALIGKKLDTRFETAPWFLAAGFVLAFCLSAFIVYKKAKEYAAEYKKL